jgi:predicted amidophosphoribosyltransferase
MSRLFLNEFKDYGDAEISAFGEYLPYGRHKAMGGDSTNYPTYSKKILDLKDKKHGGIVYFYGIAEPLIRKEVALVTVPSHDPQKQINGIRELAQRICIDDPRFDATEVLVRAKPVEKLAMGGDRNTDNHLKSIVVKSPHLIRGRRILLLDDVVSTGNSLRACKQLLLSAGARAVHCAALAKTI